MKMLVKGRQIGNKSHSSSGGKNFNSLNFMIDLLELLEKF